MVFGSPGPGSPLEPTGSALGPTVGGRPAREFIRAETRLRPVPHVPEIALHLADEAVPLWQKTEEELGAMGLPPPFWAFAWAGGQALARFILDRPELVADRRVLDLGAGSGLVALAAARAGAAAVLATEIDPTARAAVALNAEANGVAVEVTNTDFLVNEDALLDQDVVLAADLFYERDTAERATRFLARQNARGALVLIGDPGRSYLPRGALLALLEYSIPVTRDLEDAEIKRTTVWRFP